MPEATLDDVRRRFLASLAELESAGSVGGWQRERSRAKQVNRVLIHQWSKRLEGRSRRATTRRLEAECDDGIVMCPSHSSRATFARLHQVT